MSPTAQDFDHAQDVIMRLMRERGVADANTVLRDASERGSFSRDALSGALSTLVGQGKVRFNLDLQLELAHGRGGA